MNKERKKLLKKGRTIQVFNVIYDAIEVVVSLFAGFTANSSALIGWGLDSTVEVVSATTLGWRLHGELKGIDQERVNKRKRITLYVIAASFLTVCLFITYDSVSKFISQEVPEWSTIGLIILLVSLVVNPILIWAKYTTGKKLESEALIADAKDTFICLYQTVVVLAGLLLVRWFDWWWADPVAALLIVPYALKEAWHAFKSARNVQIK